MLAATARLLADVVETKDGSRIVGKVMKIDGGVVTVTTKYAGKIEIKQVEVTIITTDAPVAVRLSSGTRLEGTISGADGSLQITGREGTVVTPVEKVAASWAAGDEDPAIVALRRHWGYEASLDINGTSGNKTQLGTRRLLSVRRWWRHRTPWRSTRPITARSQTARNPPTSSRRASTIRIISPSGLPGMCGTRAASTGSRTMKFYDVAAAGLGYDFIKEAKHLLTLRAGLSYRFEDYGNPMTPDVSTAGLDLGLNHEYQFGVSEAHQPADLRPFLSGISAISG